MSKPITEVLPRNLLEHWAVQAWNQLGTAPATPDAIQILKRRTKSAVYRLEGANSEGSAVIAKRGYACTIQVENLIYQQLLPRLGLPALRCYGFMSESAGNYSWLFLEDAVGLEYSCLNTSHRMLAGEWLAALHRAAWDLGRIPDLPDRDCDYYHEELRLVAAQVRSLLTNPVVPPDDLAVLQSLRSECDVIDAHWQELEGRCAGFPPAIVHGDLVTKNVRVRSDPPPAALLVFDWEVSGWGVPATDLAPFIGRTLSPDLPTYCAALARHGIRQELRALRLLAESGSVFRLIDDMAWACLWLVDDSYSYLKKPISFLRSYEVRLANLLSKAGWLG